MISRLKYFFVFSAALMLLSSSGVAQKFLAIDKSGKVKRIRFYENEKINIRLNDENFFRTGNIDAIGDSSFVFDGKTIALSDINAIIVYKNDGGHAFIKELSSNLPAGGVFLLLVTAANSLINASYPLVPVSMYIISGSLVAGGFLLRPLTYRIYKAKKYPLKIMDVSIATEEN